MLLVSDFHVSNANGNGVVSRMMFHSRTNSGGAAAISQTLGEADRSLHDALCVIRSLVKKR